MYMHIKNVFKFEVSPHIKSACDRTFSFQNISNIHTYLIPATRRRHADKMNEMEEEEMVSSARLEPSTLQWTDRNSQIKRTSPDNSSLHGAESQTESELELGRKIEEKQREEAAQIFSPQVTVLRSTPLGSKEFWDTETEKMPFLGAHIPPGEDYYPDWFPEEQPSKCKGLFLL